MASLNKKRTFAEMLGGSNKITSVPTYTVPRIKVTNQKWSDLSQQVANNRATILSHSYVVAATGQAKRLQLTHTHGEFNKIISDTGTVQIGTHNISTAELGRSARSYPKLLADITTRKGATDVLRVLKGTHLTKGLLGSTPEKRQAAVEFGGEIGISEYTRGASAALTDAAINLYRMKHGDLAKADFADHTKGYSGAGKGGAERLRKLTSIEKIFKPYTGLRDIYDNHASTKTNRPWETNVRKNATADEKYDAWRVYKFKSWTQREK